MLLRKSFGVIILALDKPVRKLLAPQKVRTGSGMLREMCCT